MRLIPASVSGQPFGCAGEGSTFQILGGCLVEIVVRILESGSCREVTVLGDFLTTFLFL